MQKQKTDKFVDSVIRKMDQTVTTWQRFNNCNAYVGEYVPITYNGEDHIIIPIKSYNTIVAFVDFNENKFYEYGKYSQTTSKQVTQIHNHLFGDTERIFIDTYTGHRW